MGYELRRALADGLSADVQGTRRFVLLEIADLAKDETGLAYSGQWGEEEDLLTIVARRCGLASGKQVGKVLDKLAEAGFETRVQIGVKSSGQPLFCCRGRQTTYDLGALADRLLPRMEEQPGMANGEVAPPFGGATVGIAPPSGTDCSPAQAVLHPHTGEPALSYSSTPELASSLDPQPKDKADQALTRHGIPLTDRPSIERFLREVKKATSPGGLIVTLDEQGRLGAVLIEWRAWAAPTPTPPRVNGVKPPCPLDCATGWLEDPDNDLRPRPCPSCQPRHRLNTPA